VTARERDANLFLSVFPLFLGCLFTGFLFRDNSVVFEHCDRFIGADHHMRVVHGDGNGEGGPSEPPFAALSDEEVERCLLTMNDTQYRAVFRLMVDLGLGPGELFGDNKVDRGLYIQDIDSRKMLLKVHYRSNEKQPFSVREVPLTTHCMTAIKDFLFSGARTLHDSGKLLDITDRRWRQVLMELPESAGIDKKMTVLVLRRTAIIKMLRDRLHPDEIRRRMGILREKEEIVVYTVGFMFNDAETYDQLIKQAVYDTLVIGGQPFTIPSGFSALRRV